MDKKQRRHTMAVRTRRIKQARDAPPVTLIIRCPECRAGILLQDIEDGKCPWCKRDIERKV